MKLQLKVIFLHSLIIRNTFRCCFLTAIHCPIFRNDVKKRTKDCKKLAGFIPVSYIYTMFIIRFILKLLFRRRIHYILTDKPIQTLTGITNTAGTRFLHLGNNTYFRTFFKRKFKTK